LNQPVICATGKNFLKERQNKTILLGSKSTFLSSYREATTPHIPDVLNMIEGAEPFQMQMSYIVFDQPKGITLLHQQLAHQQILFEKFNASWTGKALAIQQELFPQAIQFSPSDFQLVGSILPDLLQMGYQLEAFGINTYVLQGAPA